MSDLKTVKDQFNTLPIEDVREIIGDYLVRGKGGQTLWTLMTVTRGPDTPSERPYMTSEEHNAAYKGRRDRKANTGEVLRSRLFGGKIGGAARVRRDRDYVLLPPRDEWDHYDRHVEQAAQVLGLEVRIINRVKGVKVDRTPRFDPANPTPEQWKEIVKGCMDKLLSGVPDYFKYMGLQFYMMSGQYYKGTSDRMINCNLKGEWKTIYPPGMKPAAPVYDLDEEDDDDDNDDDDE